MPRGGSLEVATRNVDGKPDGRMLDVSTQDRWVSVTITDTGAGMDEATRQNIFEPFFTTREVGEGTGLGLATVYGVMQQNAGWIDVNSELGAGTSFSLHFPRIDHRAIVPVGLPTSLREAHGGETVLLVEDQEAVREFLRAVLEDSGYKVVEAGNGAEALIVAAGRSDEIQLLITDVIMPGINGRELAERLSLERPNLKTIFMSGYLADVIAHSGVLDRDVAFLQKPVTPETLAAKVRDVLTAASDGSWD
jgi:two-component system cell cycle sensor histidine kinase/response regulator CckA